MTIFEAYVTPGGRLRTGSVVYVWRRGARVNDCDALFERIGIAFERRQCLHCRAMVPLHHPDNVTTFW